MSLADELAKLAELHRAGAITAEEFTAAKTTLMKSGMIAKSFRSPFTLVVMFSVIFVFGGGLTFFFIQGPWRKADPLQKALEEAWRKETEPIRYIKKEKTIDSLNKLLVFLERAPSNISLVQWDKICNEVCGPHRDGLGLGPDMDQIIEKEMSNLSKFFGPTSCDPAERSKVILGENEIRLMKVYFRRVINILENLP